jgi:hypothetical protein
LAQEIAAAELARRGVDANAAQPRKPVPATESAVAAADPWTPAQVLWWLYFGLFVIGLPIHVALMAWRGGYTTDPTWLVNYFQSAVDLLGIVGLYGYIRSIRLLIEGFWQVVVTVFAGKLAIGACFLVYNLWGMPETRGLYPWRYSTEYWVATLGLLGLVFATPQLWALFRYAFGSRALWRQTSGGAIG